ncbi:MAG: flagellar export protein FliJ [Phycisphaerae bacterium]
MAKNFRFRLSKVLDIRVRARDEQRIHFARAQAAVQEVDMLIDSLRDSMAANGDAGRRALSATRDDGTLDIEVLRSQVAVQRTLEARISQQLQHRSASAAHLEEQRAKLVEASRMVRVIEKLRERQLAQHMEAERLAEARAADDAASSRYTNLERSMADSLSGEIGEVNDAG